MQSIVEKQVGPDLMLYDGEVDSVHVLNPSARIIYDMRRRGLELQAISTALRDRFEIPAEHALEEDILQVIQDLVSRGLLDQ
jgi:Coenzyme PQQ synthesis protein D (PqqD)